MPNLVYRYDGPKTSGDNTVKIITKDANDIVREVPIFGTILLSDEQVAYLRIRSFFSLSTDPLPNAPQAKHIQYTDEKNEPGGYVGLNESGKIESAYLEVTGATGVSLNSTPIAIAVKNSFIDPRATVSSHFAAVAPGGSVTQTPTPRADGYQQVASPKSCQEIIATPADTNTYAGVQTKAKASGFTQYLGGVPGAGACTVAARWAGKVTNAGGSSWYAALVIVYYSDTDVKTGEVPVWTGRPGLNNWFVAEGFDGQAPTNSSYAEFELRVYGSTSPVTLRHTEIVIVHDPTGDVPGYVGGDIGVGGDWSGGANGWWTGTADNSSSIGIFDPLKVYPSQEFGFNDFTTYSGFIGDDQAIAMCVAIGATVDRILGILSDTPGTLTPLSIPEADPEGIQYAKDMIAAGIKVIINPNPPTGFVAAVNDAWPTTTAGRDAYNQYVLDIIDELGAENVYAVEFTNEPNHSGFNLNDLSPASYSAWVTSAHNAIKALYPDIKTLAGVLSLGGAGANATMDTWIDGMYSANCQYDYLDIHPYPIATLSGGANSSGPLIIGGSAGYGLDEGYDVTMRKLRDKLAAHGDSNRPIFISELGILASVYERMQSAALALLVGRVKRDPQIKGLTIHCLVSSESISSSLVGASMLDPQSLRPRPSFHQVAMMHGRRLPPIYDETIITDPTTAFTTGRTETKGNLVAQRGKGNEVSIGATIGLAPGFIIGSGSKSGILYASGVGQLKSSPIIASPSVATVVPLVAQGFAAQTADLFQAQSSSGAIQAKVTAAGDIIARPGQSTQVTIGNTFGTPAIFFGLGTGLTSWMIATATNELTTQKMITSSSVATQTPLVAKGFAAQTANLFEAQNSSATALFAVDSAGLPRWVAAANQQTTVGAAGAGSALPATPTKYLKVKDSAGTTLVVPAYAAS